jgi:hypothetical protein
MRPYALAVASQVQAVEDPAFQASVHSDIRRVLNLTASRVLASIADVGGGLLPNCVGVNLPVGWRFDRCGLRAGTRANRSQVGLRFDSHDLESVLQRIALEVVSRTTEIASNYLSLATKGELSSRLHGYIAPLMTGTDSELATATADLVAVGATSGAEVALEER